MSLRLLLIIIYLTFYTNCWSKSHENTTPSAAQLVKCDFSSKELLDLTPDLFFEILKNSVCAVIGVQKTDISSWKSGQYKNIKPDVESISKSPSIESSNSSVKCENYGKSTLGHEAKHLLKAKKLGYYPVANCSTYDLSF